MNKLFIIAIVVLCACASMAAEQLYHINLLNQQGATIRQWTLAPHSFTEVAGGIIVDCKEIRIAWYGPYELYIDGKRPENYKIGRLPYLAEVKPKPAVKSKGKEQPKPTKPGTIGSAFSKDLDDFTLPSTKK